MKKGFSIKNMLLALAVVLAFVCMAGAAEARAASAGKLEGKIDYTQADNENSTSVLSAVFTDADKRAVAVPSDELVWCETSDGEYQAADTLTGGVLRGWLEEGKSKNIYIKRLGVETNDGKEDVNTSAAVKVKIGKQGKAPSVKVDAKNKTVNIRNGYDFARVEKQGGSYVLAQGECWHTVLPYNKKAENKEYIFAAEDFEPRDKNDEGALEACGSGNKASYTKTKLSKMTLEELYSTVGSEMSDTIIIGVRKSSTCKAPASAVAYCEIKNK